MSSRANAYSATWHELFSERDDAERTAAEVAFIARVLPRGRVLDACCGYGRHAGGLAALGYEVIALDRDPAVIGEARDRHRGVDFRVLDVRKLDLSGFDAAICMWASFGWFDDAGNADVLRRLANAAPCVVLDLHNRAFFESRQGRWEVRPGVVETKRVEGDRLRVELDYGDVFEWRLYEPEAVAALVPGLRLDLACARFDEATPPSEEEPRMQLVLSKEDKCYPKVKA